MPAVLISHELGAAIGPVWAANEDAGVLSSVSPLGGGTEALERPRHPSVGNGETTRHLCSEEEAKCGDALASEVSAPHYPFLERPVRARAEQLVREAAALLASLGENDARVAWLLEDTAAMIALSTAQSIREAQGAIREAQGAIREAQGPFERHRGHSRGAGAGEVQQSLVP